MTDINTQRLHDRINRQDEQIETQKKTIERLNLENADMQRQIEILRGKLR